MAVYTITYTRKRKEILMKKYCTVAFSIILLAFILIFCSASAETAAESPAVVTTDIAVISASAAEPSKVAETTPPETDNTPFDLTPYYIKPEPVSEAYRFTIITRYYDGASDNNFVLPQLTSYKNGAASLNKKIKDNFLSKRNALLNQLSDTGSVQTITASSDYSYTVNSGIIVISLELRSFAVINLYNKSPGYYKCNISAEDVLTANNIDPVIFGTKPGLDIYPESINNESKILTVKYKFIGYNLTGELYYNTETNEVYFPHNEEKPVYIADASRLIDNVGNSILFTFPHKGITLTMTLPDEIITSKYNASGNYETILTRNIGWDMSINCYRNYTSVKTTPEEGCKAFFTSSESYPGQWEMVSENTFVSDIIHISNGKEYSFEDEFVIAYYLSGKDDIFITLNCRSLYTPNQIKEIAKSISWYKITK